MLSNLRKKLATLALGALLLNSWAPLAAQALSTTGPSSSDPVTGGFVVMEGNPALFDYAVPDYPELPLLDPADPMSYNGELHVTVDYGDESPIFEESYPAVDTSIHQFHIKDRSWNPTADTALDNAYGFIFNEFPYFKAYPQGHTYDVAGSYTLKINAELITSDPTVDMSLYPPLEISVPVEVIPANATPNFSFEGMDYDAGTDTATAHIRYVGPAELMLTELGISEARRSEILSQFLLELSASNSPYRNIQSSFSDWTIGSQASIPGTSYVDTIYNVTLSNVEARLGIDFETEPLYPRLRFGREALSGILNGWVILDGDLSDNADLAYIYANQHSELATTLTAPESVRIDESAELSLDWTGASLAADSLEVTVDYGDETPVETSLQPIDATSVLFSHTYTSEGTYTVQICADDTIEYICQTALITVLPARAQVDGLTVLMGYDAQTPYATEMQFNEGESFSLDAFVSGIPETASSLTIETSFPGTNTSPNSETYVLSDQSEGSWDMDASDADIDIFFRYDLTMLTPGVQNFSVCVTVDGSLPTCDNQSARIWSTFANLTATPTVSEPIFADEEMSLTFDIQNVHPDATQLEISVNWNQNDPATVYLLDPVDQVKVLNYTYPISGDFTISYCVSDMREPATCGQMPIIAQERPMAFAFSQEAAITVREDAPVTFTGTVTHIPAEVSEVDLGIEFGTGEGGTSELLTADENGAVTKEWTTTFPEPGTYQVSACSRFPGQEACDEVIVTVEPWVIQAEFVPAELNTVIREATPVQVHISNINAFSTAVTYSIDWGTETLSGNLEDVLVETNGQEELTLEFNPTFLTEGNGWISQICVTDQDGERTCDSMNLNIASDADFVSGPLELSTTGESSVNQDVSTTVTANLSSISHQATELDMSIDWNDGTIDTFNQPITDPYDVSFNFDHSYTTRGTRTIQVCANDGRGMICSERTITVAGPDLFVNLLDINPLTGVMNVNMGNEGELDIDTMSGITQVTVNGVVFFRSTWEDDTTDTALYLQNGTSLDRSFDLDLSADYINSTTENVVEICLDADAVTADRLRGNNCAGTTFTLPSVSLDVAAESLEVAQYEGLVLPINIENLREGTTSFTLSADFGSADAQGGQLQSFEVSTGGAQALSTTIPVTYNREGTYGVRVCTTVSGVESCDSTFVTVGPRLTVELSAGMIFTQNEESSYTVNVRNIPEGTEELEYSINYDLETTGGYLTNGAMILDGESQLSVPFDVIFIDSGLGSIEFCVTAGDQNRCTTVSVTVDSDASFEDDALTLNLYGSSEITTVGSEFTLFADITNLDHQAASYDYVINWGDGSSDSSTVSLDNPFDRTGFDTHTYTTRGAYTISGCIDDGRGRVCDETTVNVNGVDLYAEITAFDTTTGILTYTLGNQGENDAVEFGGETQIDFNRDIADEIIWDTEDADAMMTYLTGSSSTEKTADLNLFDLDAEVGNNTVSVCIDTTQVSGDADFSNNCDTLNFNIDALALTLDAEVASVNLGDVTSLTGLVSTIMDGTPSLNVTVSEGEIELVNTSLTPESSSAAFALDVELTTAGTHTLTVCANDGTQSACDVTTVTVLTSDLYASITAFDSTTGLLTYELGNTGPATALTEGGTTVITLNETVADETIWVTEDAEAMLTYLAPGTSATKEFNLNLFDLGTFAGGSENTVQVCIDSTEVSGDTDTTDNCAELTFTLPFMSIALDSEDETIRLGDEITLEGTVSDIMDGVPSMELTVSEDGTELSSEIVTPESTTFAFALPVELETTGTHNLTVCAKTTTAETCANVVITVVTSDLFATITSYDSTTGVLTYKVGNQGDVYPDVLTGRNEVSMDGEVWQINEWSSDSSNEYLAPNTSSTRTFDFPIEGMTFTDGQIVSVEVCVDTTSVTRDFSTENNCASTTFTVDLADAPTSTPSAPTSTGGGFTGGGNSDRNNNSGNDEVQLASEEPAFTDVPETDENFEAIQYLYDQGVVEGYEDQTFRPENITNRAEFVKLIVASLGKTPSAEDFNNCFPDVTDQWYAPYVCYAEERGWIQGYPDGLFRPEQTVNRVESLKMIVGGFELDTALRNDMMGIFTDVEDNAWYEIFVEVALHFGLIDPASDHLLKPANGMTRGDLAEILYRAMQL